jgi:hypothetical protein
MGAALFGQHSWGLGRGGGSEHWLTGSSQYCAEANMVIYIPHRKLYSLRMPRDSLGMGGER